jgi:hypothetical protein
VTAAEKLARQIKRVAELRGATVAQAQAGTIKVDATTVAQGMAQLDLLLDRACRAIGSGDTGAIEAVGLELEDVE